MRHFIFACLILGSIHTYAQERWTPLFNAKNLDGWKQLNGRAKYQVNNGEIIGTTVVDEPNSFLITEKIYSNFILELEFILDSDMNSGIQFRSESNPAIQNGRVIGYQCEIDPSERAWTGGIYDEGRRDWLYPLEYNPQAKPLYKPGQWNRIRIECNGPISRTWVNGLPAAHLVDSVGDAGFIALQVHSIYKPEDAGKTIRWRNIRIQENPTSFTPLDQVYVVNLIPGFLSKQEQQLGVKLLFDGTTAGWRGANLTSFPESDWIVGNQQIIVKPRSRNEGIGSDLVTTDEFDVFDLSFEFQLTPGANSGVKYFVTESGNKSDKALGLEYQLVDDSTHPDAQAGFNGNRTQGSLYDLITSLKVPRGQRKVGDWNLARIVVYPDNRVEHWLNGYKVVTYIRGSSEFVSLIAKSKYANYKNFGLVPRGRILLQHHGDKVLFRNIRVKSF